MGRSHLGVVGGISCNYATKLKYFLRADDALDIFAVHAVGGFVGDVLTAFFAAYVQFSQLKLKLLG